MSRGVAAMLLAAPLAWPTPGVAQEDTAAWQAGVDGVGPIHIGMSLEQARKAAGQPLLEQPGHHGDDRWKACHYAFLSRNGALDLALGLMLEDGTVTRIDIAAADVPTLSGARVGDTEHSIIDRYQGRTEGGQGGDGKHFLVVYLDRRRQLVFVFDDGHVASYRVGQVPAVHYAQGCA